MSTPERLTASKVAAKRTELLREQGNKCALCRQALAPGDAVLDHCHSSGFIRGTLHRGCNSLLGKLENNFKRYGVKNLVAFCQGVIPYLNDTEGKYNVLHPTFRTEDQKRLARNAAARKRRAAAKEKAQ